MSIASAAVGAQPPYRSFEELRSAQIPCFKSNAADRFFWPLDGSFPEAISVMESINTPHSLTPYFSNGTFHPISQEPISSPKISAVTVHVAQLDNWETMWLERHDQHDHVDPEERWHGDLEDYDPDSDSDEEEHLLHCCEGPRPRGKKAQIVVRPASGDFVTVHDYLSTVHPWLMSLKGEIEKVRADVYMCGISDLMVDFIGVKYLQIDDRSHWIEFAPMKRRVAPVPEPVNQLFPVFGPSFQPDPSSQSRPPIDYLPKYSSNV